MTFFSERNAEVGMTSILILCGLIFLSCIFPGCKAFFSEYQGVFTFFGFFAAVIALLFAWHQIKAAKNQIKATLVYEMRRDGHRVIDSLNPMILQYIQEAPETEIDKPDGNELKRAISKIFRYYSSLERQNEYENIDQKEWELIVSNFSAFLNKPVVREYWNKEVKDNPLWSDGFKRLGTTCFKGGKR